MLAYFNRANTRQLQKRYKEAIADYDRAIELDPKFAWAYAGRGLVHLLEKRQPQADADFARALEIDPSIKPDLDTRVNELKAETK